ncbi:MAG: glycosyltransferase [Prevotella sp.]|nr:glycosyltransferase [Prevotella sp.]
MNKIICFVTTGDIKNNASSKRALGHANHLSDLGWQVCILMQDTIENRHRVELECSKDIVIKYFPSCKPSNERKIKNCIIKKINPDYIYLCAFVNRNIVARHHKCKKIVEHSEYRSSYPKFSRFRRFLMYCQEELSIFYADGFVNASRTLNEIFKKRATKVRRNIPMLYLPYAFHKKMCVRINGVIPNILQSDENRIVVFLGTLGAGYGVYTMIDAFRLLKNDYPHLNLLLLGKGAEYNDVVKYIKEKGVSDVIYAPGFIAEEDVPSYFSIADAFILPMNDNLKDWTRCPSKLYMYLPYQKPIITCKIGEPYEVLKENGCYYIPSDVKSLYECVKKLAGTNEWTMSMNIEEHEWKSRTETLHNWINQSFDDKNC